MGADRITDLQRELALMPTVWTALLEEHTVDPHGRCRGCHSSVGAGQQWPCTLYWLAARARRIAISA